MDIVNHSYPRGRKFYEVHDSKHDMCRKVFCRTMYNAAMHISQYAGHSNECLGAQYVTPWTSSLEIFGTTFGEYPKFKILSARAFHGVSEGINSVIMHKKTNYQSIVRIRDLGNMPWEQGMVIQWDDDRGGFIVDDVAYEGEMDSVPKSGIGKLITETLKDIVAEAGMFELLGESTYVEAYYSDSIQADKNFRSSFEALVDGTQTTKQTTDIAIGSGAYTCIHDYDRAKQANTAWQSQHGQYTYPPSSPNYKLTRTGNKPKISTITRQFLLFKYGGLKLPENYEDWFDG